MGTVWTWIAASRWKGRAWIFGFQPIDDSFDAFDVFVSDIMFFAERCGHIDMSNVKARRGINPVKRLQKNPIPTEIFGDFVQVRLIIRGETVSENTEIIAGIGVVKAGFAFENGLAARCAVFRHSHCEEGISDGAPFAERAPATSDTFQISARQIHALCNGTVNKVCIESDDLGVGDGGTKNSENRTRMESARHHGWNEIGR